jgi:hypothetical protein
MVPTLILGVFFGYLYLNYAESVFDARVVGLRNSLTVTSTDPDGLHSAGDSPAKPTLPWPPVASQSASACKYRPRHSAVP